MHNSENSENSRVGVGVGGRGGREVDSSKVQYPLTVISCAAQLAVRTPVCTNERTYTLAVVMYSTYYVRVLLLRKTEANLFAWALPGSKMDPYECINVACMSHARGAIRHKGGELHCALGCHCLITSRNYNPLYIPCARIHGVLFVFAVDNADPARGHVKA